MSDESTERTIRVFNFERFEDKLATLNRKAIKLGFQPIKYAKHDLVTESFTNEYGEKETYQYWPVDLIDSNTIELPGGWQLLATLDHFENLNRVVPGYELPLFYRDRGPVCDHCGKDRNRKETFVLISEDGITIQVGRSCLGLYFGIDPAHVLSQIDFFNSMQEDEESWGGERTPIGFGLDGFLSHVALFIRTDGWLSRSEAQSRMRTSTADLAWFNITEKSSSIKKIRPTPDDEKVGRRAADWMKSLVERKDLNDYMHNLMQIGQNGFVTHRSAGYAASSINAMNKEIEQQTAHLEKRHLGQIGQKLCADVKLVNSFPKFTDYGPSYSHRFLTSDGNVIIWSTATELEIGKDYYIEGKIKDHSEFNGEPQTIVTRCKVI